MSGQRASNTCPEGVHCLDYDCRLLHVGAGTCTACGRSEREHPRAVCPIFQDPHAEEYKVELPARRSNEASSEDEPTHYSHCARIVETERRARVKCEAADRALDAVIEANRPQRRAKRVISGSVSREYHAQTVEKLQARINELETASRTQEAKADPRLDVLDAAERICREVADGYTMVGEHKRASAAEECADQVAAFANTFRVGGQRTDKATCTAESNGEVKETR